ncbi:MAG: histidinol dehydrogenase [Candidatus Sumerlaeia bacterium]|nr:histidinol dehydrogenase [Candidatus Sumerlaeia bacterium]
MPEFFRQLSPSQVRAIRHDPVDADTISAAGKIVDHVRRDGEKALRLYAEKFGELEPGAPLVLDRAALKKACEAVPEDVRALLERTAARIRQFAKAQREGIRDIQAPISGGMAGHTVDAVERAGCYAPGGRFPLPSTMLMTAVTARVAGVKEVWAASPKPAPATLAAAYIAGVDYLLVAGGAQAIAALAYGAGDLVRPCDVIVGPGSRWVTAAKFLVSAHVAIDMLAGPSELVVLADESADPSIIAADLLAQAEHDTVALPVLVTTSQGLIDRTRAEVRRQLESLPTADTATPAMENGFAVLCESMEEAISITDTLAPEHLEVMTKDPRDIGHKLSHYGAIFVGEGSAEVLGDYGAGPNHTLPTGGRARYTGGLSVFHFLRVRTWMRIDDRTAARGLVEDSIALGRLEGLEGHARSAEKRL